MILWKVNLSMSLRFGRRSSGICINIQAMIILKEAFCFWSFDVSGNAVKKHSSERFESLCFVVRNYFGFKYICDIFMFQID